MSIAQKLEDDYVRLDLGCTKYVVLSYLIISGEQEWRSVVIERGTSHGVTCNESLRRLPNLVDKPKPSY